MDAWERVRFRRSLLGLVSSWLSLRLLRAVWFKVHHEGKYADGKWAATEAIEKKNGTYTFRIPPNLLPGQYLIRHEWYGFLCVLSE